MFTQYKGEKNKLQMVTEAAVNTSWEFKGMYRNSEDLDINAVTKRFVGLYKEGEETPSTYDLVREGKLAEAVDILTKAYSKKMALIVLGFGILHRITDGGRSAGCVDSMLKVVSILSQHMKETNRCHIEILKYSDKYDEINPYITTYISENTYMTYIEKIYLYTILHSDSTRILSPLRKLKKEFVLMFAVRDRYAEYDNNEVVVGKDTVYNYDISKVLTYFTSKLEDSKLYVGKVANDMYLDVPTKSDGSTFLPGSINNLTEATSDRSIGLRKERKKPLRAFMVNKEEAAKVARVKTINENIEYYKGLVE